MEGLHGSIRHSMRAYWGTHMTATLQELARYAMSLRSLHSRSALPATTSCSKQMEGRQECRRYCSNLDVLVTDSSETSTMNNSPTNTDWTMAINNGIWLLTQQLHQLRRPAPPCLLKQKVAAAFASALIMVQRRARYCLQMSAKGW